MWDRTENQIMLVLIRHGATRSNKEHRYLGKTDEALSEEGKKKLEEYKKLQYYPDIDCLYSSPLKRCVQTAKILYPGFQCMQIEEWKEIDFGAFEGKNHIELQGDERYQEWIDSNGMLPFPEGESREEFIARCDKGFRKMIQEVIQGKEKEEHLAIGMIVHGGTIMAILSKYFDGDYFDYRVVNGKGYVCNMNYYDGKPKIMELKKI